MSSPLCQRRGQEVQRLEARGDHHVRRVDHGTAFCSQSQARTVFGDFGHAAAREQAHAMALDARHQPLRKAHRIDLRTERREDGARTPATKALHQLGLLQPVAVKSHRAARGQLGAQVRHRGGIVRQVQTRDPLVVGGLQQLRKAALHGVEAGGAGQIGARGRVRTELRDQLRQVRIDLVLQQRRGGRGAAERDIARIEYYDPLPGRDQCVRDQHAGDARADDGDVAIECSYRARGARHPYRCAAASTGRSSECGARDCGETATSTEHRCSRAARCRIRSDMFVRGFRQCHGSGRHGWRSTSFA